MTLRFMKPCRRFLATVLASICSFSISSAEVIMRFSTGAAYTQYGPFDVRFDGGDLNLNLRDGNGIQVSCFGFDPYLEIVPPIQPGCPLGTTAFIAFGDENGDGIRDLQAFYSLSEVIPAFLVEPFRPDLVEMASAPPSDLPRNLGTAKDFGWLIFYNVLTPNVLQFNVTEYEIDRVYPEGIGGQARMKDELVVGLYIFSFPFLRNAEGPKVNIPVVYRAIPEGFDLTDRYPEDGFRFTSGTWSNGEYLMDPRLTNRITWTGNDVSNIFPGVDILRLSFNGEYIDPLTLELVEGIVFPPSRQPVQLESSLVREYYLAPDFFEVGDTGTARLQFNRFLGSNAVAFDSSVRFFEFNYRFVNSYQGYALRAFPLGTDSRERSAGFDFDKDGFTNFEEFAQGTDPTDPTDFPADILPEATLDGKVFFTVAKVPNAMVAYSFSVSTDGVNFVQIKEGNPDWEFTIDDENTLKITSVNDADVADYEAILNVKNIPLN